MDSSSFGTFRDPGQGANQYHTVQAFARAWKKTDGQTTQHCFTLTAMDMDSVIIPLHSDC